MNNIKNIFLNAKGIFESSFYCPSTYNQIKIKDLDKYIYYLQVEENKIYLYTFYKKEDNLFDKFTNYFTSIKENSNSLTKYSLYEKKRSISLANWIYDTNYYKTKFKQLSFSLEKEHQMDDFLFDNEKLINLYSIDDIPLSYYNLTKNDLYNNIKIVSHILYKHELNDYIKKFEILKNE
jgi:hypothetical protein